MAIYIVERTEFLMEFMLFRYHKIRKENIHLPDVSNKQCYLTFFLCNPQLRLCQLGCFCAINQNCIECIIIMLLLESHVVS